MSDGAGTGGGPAAPGSRSPRIGLFGGSFDPPHRAHLALAEQARRQLHLEQVLWLPAGRPWQKAARTLAAPDHRLAMLALLLDGAPGHAVDPRELQRAGPSYTLDTVEELARERPGAELVLILGQDQCERLPTWHRWQELLGRVTLAVAGRDGRAPAVPPALQAVPHRLQALDLPALAVSSTAVRERVARGQAVDDLTGAQVARYIARHQPYPRPPTEGDAH